MLCVALSVARKRGYSWGNSQVVRAALLTRPLVESRWGGVVPPRNERLVSCNYQSPRPEPTSRMSSRPPSAQMNAQTRSSRTEGRYHSAYVLTLHHPDRITVLPHEAAPTVRTWPSTRAAVKECRCGIPRQSAYGFNGSETRLSVCRIVASTGHMPPGAYPTTTGVTARGPLWQRDHWIEGPATVAIVFRKTWAVTQAIVSTTFFARHDGAAWTLPSRKKAE